MVNATDRTALSAGVVCEPALDITSPPVGQKLQITLSVYNSYSRPASHATVRAAAVMAVQGGPQFSQHKQRILTNASIPREDGVKTRVLSFVSASGQPFGLLTSEAVENIKSRRIEPFVYGEIEFHDAAGCHRQEFCYRFNPPSEHRARTLSLRVAGKAVLLTMPRRIVPTTRTNDTTSASATPNLSRLP